MKKFRVRKAVPGLSVGEILIKVSQYIYTNERKTVDLDADYVEGNPRLFEEIL